MPENIELRIHNSTKLELIKSLGKSVVSLQKIKPVGFFKLTVKASHITKFENELNIRTPNGKELIATLEPDSAYHLELIP